MMVVVMVVALVLLGNGIVVITERWAMTHHPSSMDNRWGSHPPAGLFTQIWCARVG